MKTPTNFIPIIGPLYADDLQFGILSDQMFKTDINEINSALTTINKLNPK